MKSILILIRPKYRCLVALLFIASSAKAQEGPGPVSLRFKNAIGVGINYVTLDMPDNVVLHYQAQYIRYSRNERLGISGALGYLEASNAKNPLTPYQRKRITSDLTFALAPLKIKSHFLRLGMGFSAWYRDDKVVSRTHYKQTPDGIGYDIVVDFKRTQETIIGIHYMIEYEYKFTQRIASAAKIALADLGRAGYSTITGVALRYRL